MGWVVVIHENGWVQHVIGPMRREIAEAVAAGWYATRQRQFGQLTAVAVRIEEA